MKQSFLSMIPKPEFGNQKQRKEFQLELVNFDKRGQPHATFTVCQLDFVD